MLVALVLMATARALGANGWENFADELFRHYSQEDGLPDPVVTTIAEDGSGFLWIGTQGGLARWDGYRFRIFKPAAGDAGSLPAAWITSLHTDARARLWIGTSAGGLVRYDSDSDHFISYSVSRPGEIHGQVSAVADDGDDALWIGTATGLEHLSIESGLITSWHPIPGDSGSLPDDRVTAVLADRRGTLWVGTRHGLVRRVKAGARFDVISLDDANMDPVVVTQLLEDSTGNVWIGTKHGAFVISPGAERAKLLEETADRSGHPAREWIYSIAEGSAGEVWLGTYGHGITVVDTRSGTTRRLRHDPLRQQSLADDVIWALHRDRTGTVWVGTTVGLSRMTASHASTVITVAPKTTLQTGLSEGDVVSLASTADGRVWAGLHDKGIDILDLAHGRIDNIRPDAASPKTTLPDTAITALQEGLANDVYAGTNRGVYHIAQRDFAVERLDIAGRHDAFAQTNRLMMIGGRLWIAGDEDGVWVVAAEGATPAPVEHFDQDKLTDRRTTTMVLGASGELWIGTRNGLNRVDLATRMVERIYPDARNPNALSAGYIGCLLVDRMGRLWVGTIGAGIQILKSGPSGHRSFRRMTSAEGLPNDNIDSMMTDANGRIWVATDNGIAVVDPSTFQVRLLHRTEGVSIAAYWLGSGMVTNTGEIVFGGAGGGLTVIRSATLRPWDYHPPIVVTEATIGGVHIAPGRFDRGLAAPELVVHPEANSLSVEFAALDYSAPERNRYQYQLEGYDRGWVDIDSSRRLATYTNLPPGDYRLHLRGSNREGAWSDRTLNLPVRVVPTWYQTIWFKVVVACLAATGIILLVQVRTMFLRRRQRELMRQVAERTAELEQSKRQIEEIAYHDALTGLPNRRLFTSDICQLIAAKERKAGRFGLLLIDLDRFKQINDTLGHDAGDALLVECARRLKATLRASDRIARLGGDEFAILLDDLSAATAEIPSVEALCQRVIDSLAVPILYKDFEMKTGASIGVAIYPDHAVSHEGLYKAADVALYAAKRDGRGTWRWSKTEGVQASVA